MYIRTHAVWTPQTEWTLSNRSCYLLSRSDHNTPPHQSKPIESDVPRQCTMLHACVSVNRDNRISSHTCRIQHPRRPNHTQTCSPGHSRARNQGRQTSARRYTYCCTPYHAVLLRSSFRPRSSHFADVTPRKGGRFLLFPRSATLGPVTCSRHTLRRPTQLDREPDEKLRQPAIIRRQVLATYEDVARCGYKIRRRSCSFWYWLGLDGNLSWSGGASSFLSAGLGSVVGWWLLVGR